MKKSLTLIYLIGVTSICTAQKKNYFSVESGAYFGNTNSNIEANMIRSGFGDAETPNFFWIFPLDFNSPTRTTNKISYRVKYGHCLNNKTAIEAGFGLSYSGQVRGHDNNGGQSPNYLTLTSNINTLYVALVKTDTRGATGFGIGPAFSFYKLTKDISSGSINESKTYFLPGVMVNGFWRFIARPFWFFGMGIELSFSAPAKIDEIKITTQTSTSIFKSTKAGSFSGNISLNAGFRF